MFPYIHSFISQILFWIGNLTFRIGERVGRFRSWFFTQPIWGSKEFERSRLSLFERFFSNKSPHLMPFGEFMKSLNQAAFWWSLGNVEYVWWCIIRGCDKVNEGSHPCRRQATSNTYSRWILTTQFTLYHNYKPFQKVHCQFDKVVWVLFLLDALLYYNIYLWKCVIDKNDLKYNINTVYQQRFQNLKMFSQFNSIAISAFKSTQFICVQIQEGLRIIFQFGIYIFGCRTVRLVLGPLKLPIVTVKVLQYVYFSFLRIERRVSPILPCCSI